MVDTLCADGDFSKEEAVCALLSSVLGLRPEESAEDRTLYHRYLRPCVHVYSPDRYASDPYVKCVAGSEISLGRWEYKMKEYPPYRVAVAADVETEADGLERMPLCFFDGPFSFFAVTEEGNEWMTLTPVDLDTSDYAIERAHGRVATFGLGLGYYAYMVSRKPEVESITVIEKSEKVIALFKKYILPQFEHPEKVRIIHADAFEYAEKECPRECYDVIFLDTWRDASDGAPMYKKFKALEHLSPNTEFLYWIENFLISRLRAEKYEELKGLVEAGSDRAPKDFSEFLSRLKNPLL
jgi:hypothetical protein